MDILFSSLKFVVDWLTFSVLKLEPEKHLTESFNFFVFDTIKIFILLIFIIFVVSIIRSFLPPQKIRAILSHKYSIFNNLLAGLLGMVTPFCTCSAIPLFLGFVQAGVPLGATFTFLVASPMINEVAIVLLLGLFGWKIMLLYIVSGLIISVVSGIIIGRMKVEHLLDQSVFMESKLAYSSTKKTWSERLVYAKKYTLEIVGKVWLYIIIGVGLGALIHGYVPADFLARFAGADKWYAVPLATILGIPLYANAAGVMPLVAVLTEKGVAIGTTLAFMMAVTGLSLPEFLILKRIMKPKLIFIFASIVGVGIMLTGYLFNFILK
jgi:uncharacterized membrane protein YraQ (UPF0718 family)